MPTPPRVKITPLFTDISDPAEVLQQLVKQNQWLSTYQIEIEAFYGITSSNVQYKTIIIKCSSELLHELLARKRVVLWTFYSALNASVSAILSASARSIWCATTAAYSTSTTAVRTRHGRAITACSQMQPEKTIQQSTKLRTTDALLASNGLTQ